MFKLFTVQSPQSQFKVSNPLFLAKRVLSFALLRSRPLISALDRLMVLLSEFSLLAKLF